MAFCDALLWNHLYQSCVKAIKGSDIHLGPENERDAAAHLVSDDGLGESWKSVPLSASWSFWKDLTKPHNKVGMKTQDFAKHLQETGHFKTIASLDDIWQARTKNLRMFSNLRIFRDPIKPLWEVPQNRDGGKFVIILNKVEADAKQSATASTEPSTSAPRPPRDSISEEEDTSQAPSSKSGPSTEKPSVEVPLEYKLCLAFMILGLLGPIDQFCGCVLSIRAFGHMISIWISSSTDDQIISTIRHNISVLLSVPDESISFQRHNESIRNNTRNLSKTETRKKMREARAKGDLMEAPQQSRPAQRRKSESEKPVWGPNSAELFKQRREANADSASTSQPSTASTTTTTSSSSTSSTSTTNAPSTSSGAPLTSPRGGYRSQAVLARSLSGERVAATSADSSHPQSQHQPHYHHHQQHHPHTGLGGAGRGISTSDKRTSQQQQPVSPRGPTYTAPPSKTNITQTSPTNSISAEARKSGVKRSGATRTEKVHFEQQTQQQQQQHQPHQHTVFRRESTSSQKSGEDQLQETSPSSTIPSHHPIIPDINILAGTPPTAASPIRMASETSSKTGITSFSISTQSITRLAIGDDIARDDDKDGDVNADNDWIPAGGRHTGSSGTKSATTGKLTSASYSTRFTSATTTATTSSNDNHHSAKRRAQSVSARPQDKPDPNYISPEALFGADLPLISPRDTPLDSIPSSPPELDEEDFAWLEQHRLEQQRAAHNLPTQTLSNKLSELSMQQSESTHAAPSLSPRSQTARRRSRNKRRKSTTDSRTVDYDPSSTPSASTSQGV